MQPHQNQPSELIPKVIFIGDSAVGKSSFLVRASGRDFSHNHHATIGLEFEQIKMDVDGRTFKVQLWDTSGEERFESITASYYKKISGVVLCYAIDNRKSFERVSHWIKQVDKHVSEDVCKILVATKGDLELQRVVEESEGRRLAESYGIEFVETSGMQDRNVKEAVDMIVKKVIRSRIKTEMGISILKSVQQNKNQCGGLGCL